MLDRAQVISRTSSTKGTPVTIDALLPMLTAARTPLWLIWGEADPWIRPVVADRVVALKPDTVRVSIAAGHCPHDERPAEVNAALSDFAHACDGRSR